MEDLGTEMNLIFAVNSAQLVTEQTPAAVEDENFETGIRLLAGSRSSTFTARVDPRCRARVGSRRLSVDPERFHFFDPETSGAISSRHPVGLAS